MVQRAVGATIEEGSFVELRGRPWLVEEVRGEANDLQTLNLSCIYDDAQGERLEILWDAEIGAVALDEDGWRKTPRTLAARTATINAYYVCGLAGSFTPPDNFGCVMAIQTFPGDTCGGYEPNRPFLPHGF